MIRQGEKVTHEGTYNIDSSKNPAELNTTLGKNAWFTGSIFKIEKDTLTLCYTEGGKDRPTKFESPAGTRILLLTFKRVEKKK